MAFLGEPRFLLLDEPAAGLGPGETKHTADLITLMSEQSCVIAAEHDMDFVRALGEEVTVLHHGEVAVRPRLARAPNAPALRRRRPGTTVAPPHWGGGARLEIFPDLDFSPIIYLMSVYELAPLLHGVDPQPPWWDTTDLVSSII